MENTTAPRASKRGFFFTVMALAILSFMLLSTQVWVRTFEQKDENAAQRFKGEAMRLVLATLSDKAMSDFANASAFYATFRMANFTAYPNNAFIEVASNDSANNGTGMVEKTAYELMMYGNSSPSANARIEYGGAEKQAYTVSAWQGKIRAAANVMGFNASFGNITNFTFRQVDPWAIRVYFEMEMNISDLRNTMYQSKRLVANSTFPINGFLDPMISRNEMERKGVSDISLVAQKQIWKNLKYQKPEDLAPLLIDYHAPQGYGWFYGPITGDLPGEGIFTGEEIGKIGTYILEANRVDENITSMADLYGAVLLLVQPIVNTSNYIGADGCNYTARIEEDNCLNCRKTVRVVSGTGCTEAFDGIYKNNITVPLIVSSGDLTANQSLIKKVFRANMTPAETQSYLLIDNELDDPIDKERGYHRIWEMTPLRDMTICGFYVQGGGGPSFFQRMLARPVGSQPINNTALGIETFLVGKWAGGADDKRNDGRSRLDYEFYANSQPVERIKGMMGCKSRDMCSTANSTDEGVGKFRLTANAIQAYRLPLIACPGLVGNTGASCG